MKKPPFTITPRILNLVTSIQELVGELKSITIQRPSVKLRKENKIKTIRHSLAIEGNTLSEEHITAILENKKVLGHKKEIDEVRNALEVYDRIESINPLSEKMLLESHALLMKSLLTSSGKYRSGNVGIMKGKKVGHVAPQAKFVPSLMNDLFLFLKEDKETSFLLKACIFHYELEFIHPFDDGNGRMGRLWQQLLLMKHADVFEFLSVESLIHQEQKKYYKTLEECDKKGESTQFIEFSLELIYQSLIEFQDSYRPSRILGSHRLEVAKEHFMNRSFSRKDYLALHKDISTATASRDLLEGTKKKMILKTGTKAQAIYQFTR